MADDEAPSFIPPQLLLRLLTHHFKQDNTRVSTASLQVLDKYFETFVREAVYRAVEERKKRVGLAEAEEGDGGMLEVEDLERLIGTLLMDF
ncbi:hypothetical protein BJ508DRAFT_323962 [Ascobolus immersus RN42]|uniref:Centromere protein X n=1 Tax=Ascobolus immersus RN42 TaxID=1160509 RepID=A0A3N4ICY8_ASCIM|nr:hypothetical protein BJ508DRAFT_323962 [Ascobolus immersus RN42]